MNGSTIEGSRQVAQADRLLSLQPQPLRKRCRWRERRRGGMRNRRLRQKMWGGEKGGGRGGDERRTSMWKMKRGRRRSGEEEEKE